MAARTRRTGSGDESPVEENPVEESPVGETPDGERQLSFEEARAELESVVARLEGGATTLEEALTLWERGEELSTICLDLLQAARARVDAVGGGGTPTPGTATPGERVVP